jgi:hypothetical protein
MSNITLIMTRTPLEEVNFGEKNGRWGRMIVVKGAKVLSGRFTNSVNLPAASSVGTGFGLFDLGLQLNPLAKAALDSLAFVDRVLGRTTLPLGQKSISLETPGGQVEVIAQFDTLERFRTDSNKSKYYVQLHPRPERPYEIRMDISKRVKGEDGKQGVNDTGNCFRVHGHNTKHGGGGNAGILIHEAPHPGWLIGCIGPREINNRTVGNEKGPSRRAMEKLFNLMGGFSRGKKADLLVMDW